MRRLRRRIAGTLATPPAQEPARIARLEAKQAKVQARAEIADRATFFEEAGTHTRYVSADLPDMTFIVATGDRLGAGLFSTRQRGELATLATALTLLERLGLAGPLRARTFVDVGANIATTTVAALARHGFGRALAIEPEPRNLRMLRMNVAVNGLTGRVRTVGCAIGDAAGEAHLVVHGDSSGKHHVGGVEEAGETVVVAQRTLDDVMTTEAVDAAAVGLLWIDTQGFEGQVLSGAARVLASGVPVVAEFAPGHLRRSGGLDALYAALAEHCTHVVDLRAPVRDDGEPALVPVTELGRLAEACDARAKAASRMSSRCASDPDAHDARRTGHDPGVSSTAASSDGSSAAIRSAASQSSG